MFLNLSDGLHAALTDKIIRIFFTVARELGPGFLEIVYRRSLLIALRQAALAAEEQVALPVFFRGNEVGVFYADLVVAGLIILELEVTEVITDQHKAQLGHYLRSSKIEVGYVLAFAGTPSFQRVLLTNDRKRNCLPS